MENMRGKKVCINSDNNLLIGQKLCAGSKIEHKAQAYVLTMSWGKELS